MYRPANSVPSMPGGTTLAGASKPIFESISDGIPAHGQRIGRTQWWNGSLQFVHRQLLHSEEQEAPGAMSP
jgi:hypothetical protein